MENCPECKGKVIKEKHELVCEDCGLVLGNVNEEEGLESKVEVHNPKELGSVIDGVGEEDWKNVPIGQKRKLRRLQEQQNEIKGNKLFESQRLLPKIELTEFPKKLPKDIYESAINLFLKAKDKNLIRKGDSYEKTFAACAYIACKQYNSPISFDEITSMTHYRRKLIKEVYNLLVNGLNLKLKPTSPDKYISGFCDKLRLSQDVKNKAYEILEDIKEQPITARSNIMAGAIVYIAATLCNERRKLRDLEYDVGVDQHATGSLYRKLVDKLSLDPNLF